MADIYSKGGNRWNILGFNFTKRDALLEYTRYLWWQPEWYPFVKCLARGGF
jgi:hypothetical protein